MTNFLIWMLGFPLTMEIIRIAHQFTRKRLGLEQFDDQVQGCAQLIEWVIWLVIGYLLWQRA